MTVEGLRLILNDTITIENGLAGYADGYLWLYFSGYTLQQAAEMFFNQELTAKIIFEYGEMSDTYTGFTNCTGLQITDGQISVSMKRGENNV